MHIKYICNKIQNNLWETNSSRSPLSLFELVISETEIPIANSLYRLRSELTCRVNEPICELHRTAVFSEVLDL